MQDSPAHSEESKNIQDLDALVTRFDALLAELDIYKTALSTAKRAHHVRFGTFDSTIRQDLKHLLKLKADHQPDAAIQQALSSSNLPFFEATWAAAKRSRGVVGFRQRFQWGLQSARRGRGRGRESGVHVDVVTENGAQWVKVATLTEKRLVHDIAKEGWCESDGSEDDEDDEDDDGSSSSSNSASESAGSTIPVLRLAHDLVKAAACNRVRYQTPQVRLLLPRMTQQAAQVRKVLDKVRATGISLELGPCTTATTTTTTTTPAPRIEDALASMLAHADRLAPLTPTLNLDTTVLLALISDISHDLPAPASLNHPLKRAQAAQEQSAQDQLLPAVLYPAAAGRALVCTPEALAQLHCITAPVASAREHARAALLFGPAPADRAAFAALSRHVLPDDFCMPVRTAGALEGPGRCDAAGFAPDIAACIAARFAAHNASVFLHGWRTGQTTLTSNWTAARQVEDAIERARLDPKRRGRRAEYVSGPAVWFIPLSRSLAGMDRGLRYTAPAEAVAADAAGAVAAGDVAAGVDAGAAVAAGVEAGDENEGAHRSHSANGEDGTVNGTGDRAHDGLVGESETCRARSHVDCAAEDAVYIPPLPAP